VGGEIVQHHADQLRFRIVRIGQIAHARSEVPRGPLLRHLDMTP
jgi:hypothetical protein